MKTTPNVPVTAELLEAAGYTETQIERWYKLADRRKTQGYASLSVSDRQFRNAAIAAVAKVAAVQAKEAAAAFKRKVDGKTAIETKKHYRWVVAMQSSFQNRIEVCAGELPAMAIIQDEVRRALDKFQPVLDQLDVTKRHKMDPTIAELLELAAAYGRVATIDKEGHIADMRLVFPEDYNDLWAERFYASELPFGAVISESDELDFRSEVRVQVENRTREIYPSVVVAA